MGLIQILFPSDTKFCFFSYEYTIYSPNMSRCFHWIYNRCFKRIFKIIIYKYVDYYFI